jgi:hypothetical protein
MYIVLHVKYPSFLSDCNGTWNLPIYLRKNTQIQNFMKIRPVGAKLFHADRQTDGRTDGQKDMTKLMSLFAFMRTRPIRRLQACMHFTAFLTLTATPMWDYRTIGRRWPRTIPDRFPSSAGIPILSPVLQLKDTLMIPQIFTIKGYDYFKERTQKLLHCTCKSLASVTAWLRQIFLRFPAL